MLTKNWQNEMSELQDRAVELLKDICEGLDKEKVPMPPELLDWYIAYQNEDGPSIQLIQ